MLAVIILSALRASAQQNPLPPPEVRAHLHQIAHEFPADSLLRRELEAGVHGDGRTYPWMDFARRDGVKRAAIEFNFTWHRGLHDLKVARIMFFTDYEGPDSQVTNSERLGQVARDGLEASLEQVALHRALKGTWFESPEHQHPPKKGWVPASTVVVLHDDPWLPTSPIMYVTTDSSWGPLEDASLLGDRVALKRLLAQGNSKHVDLDNALYWAAGGDDPVLVKWLLHAGAQANSRNLPLFAAARNSRTVNIELLLDAGANPNSKDADGQSALSIVTQLERANSGPLVRRNLVNIAELLKKAGARQ